MQHRLKLPRVLILYTGGTIGMDIRESQGGLETLAIPKLSHQLLTKRFRKHAPELKSIAHCDIKIIMNRDSAHIGPDEWLIMADTIKKSWKNYDGIVLLHGTDTLAYTASALSFLLSPCLKPIVMTGAQRPLSALRSDARMNIISAVEIAAHGPRQLVNQITVFFGDKLYQGNRVRKKSAADFAAFESPYSDPLAVEGTRIRYSDSKAVSKNRNPKLLPKFSKKVLQARITPGFPAECMTEEFLSRLDGLVLTVFLSGTAPTHEKEFLEFLKRARKLKLPIVLVTEGSTQPPGRLNQQINYEAGKELIEHGCFWAGTMTPECAFVKTSLILGQSSELRRGKSFDIQEFAELWKRDFARESLQPE